MTVHPARRTLRAAEVPAQGLAVLAGVLAAAGIAVHRTGRRSGATDAEATMTLPGDGIVSRPTLVCDRVTTYAASPEEVWPWIVQLGKDRAGWYLPSPVASLVPRRRQGAWVVRPHLQRLVVGEVVPDWGPMPFTVHAVAPYRHIVYSADRGAGDDPGSSRSLALSWALVLRPVGPGTRLHLRLRMRGTARFPAAVQALGGFVDYLTIALLFAGLRQRLRAATGEDQSADQ
jgi:uncharacterized protein YndB with AHSA1/START domain